VEELVEPVKDILNPEEPTDEDEDRCRGGSGQRRLKLANLS
jgi:hypothetical protein